MNRQRGFAEVPLLYTLGVAAVIIVGLSGAVWWQTDSLDKVRNEYASFAGGVKAVGDAAVKAAKEKEAADKRSKEAADAENKSTTDHFRATVTRLREQRSSGGELPTPGPGAGDSAVAAFDRAQLERALRGLDEGVQGLVDEGSKATIDLNTAKKWAANR